MSTDSNTPFTRCDPSFTVPGFADYFPVMPRESITVVPLDIRNPQIRDSSPMPVPLAAEIPETESPYFKVSWYKDRYTIRIPSDSFDGAAIDVDADVNPRVDGESDLYYVPEIAITTSPDGKRTFTYNGYTIDSGGTIKKGGEYVGGGTLTITLHVSGEIDGKRRAYAKAGIKSGKVENREAGDDFTADVAEIGDLEKAGTHVVTARLLTRQITIRYVDLSPFKLTYTRENGSILSVIRKSGRSAKWTKECDNLYYVYFKVDASGTYVEEKVEYRTELLKDSELATDDARYFYIMTIDHGVLTAYATHSIYGLVYLP